MASIGTVTASASGTVDITFGPRDYLAEARAQEQGLAAATRRWRDAVDGVRNLFGAAVAHALSRHLDDVMLQHASIVATYESAVDDATRKATAAETQRLKQGNEAADKARELSAYYMGQIEQLTVRNEAQARLLADIVADAARRQKRSHGKLPDWYAEARAHAPSIVEDD